MNQKANAAAARTIAASGRLAGQLEAAILLAELSGKDTVSAAALRAILSIFDRELVSTLESDPKPSVPRGMTHPPVGFWPSLTDPNRGAWVLVLENAGPATMHNMELSLRLVLEGMSEGAKRESLEALRVACEAALG